MLSYMLSTIKPATLQIGALFMINYTALADPIYSIVLIKI
jgi:hypothetical protein